MLSAYRFYGQDKDTQRWYKPKNKRPEPNEWIWMVYEHDDNEDTVHMGMYQTFYKRFADDRLRWGVYVDGGWGTECGAPKLWAYVSVPPLSIEGEA